MPNVVAKMREAPTITTPENEPNWDWVKVNAQLRKVTVWNFLPLAFKPWLTVLAPRGTPCTMTNLHGEPLYQFKLYRGNPYCLRMEPSLGFPGS